MEGSCPEMNDVRPLFKPRTTFQLAIIETFRRSSWNLKKDTFRHLETRRLKKKEKNAHRRLLSLITFGQNIPAKLYVVTMLNHDIEKSLNSISKVPNSRNPRKPRTTENEIRVKKKKSKEDQAATSSSISRGIVLLFKLQISE